MRARLAGLAALIATVSSTAALAQAPSPKVPMFAEETKSSGLAHVFAGEWEFMVGGGAAAFDCNGDGLSELVLAGGVNKAQLFRNTSAKGGALSFVAQESGLELDNVSGAYPLDVDSDGVTDIVLLRVGENVLMRGLGACRFERANEAWGFDGGDAWWTSLAATWERGEEWPTIALGSYIDRKEEISPWGSCTDNWLLRPAADKSAFGAPNALKPSFCPLSMLFTDWNRSGTPALRVSNDREYYQGGQEQLWRIDPGQPPALYTEEEGWKPLRIWGMGIAASDVDEDGYPDFFLTSMADNKLQMLGAPVAGAALRPDYKDVAYARGVTAHRPYVGDDLRPSTAWHAQFEDVNNDGRVDLFVAKGNVWEMPDFAMEDPNNLLVQSSDGKFVEVGDKSGVASVAQGRGGALADFNLDGLVDLVVVNRNSPAQIWRNVTPGAGSWIEVRLAQPGVNRDAVGAWLEVRCGDKTMRREIAVGGGHAGGQQGFWHFGLGDETRAEVRVIWPDGESSAWQAVAANDLYVAERGEPIAKWTGGK